jgi:hypothetical protein
MVEERWVSRPATSCTTNHRYRELGELIRMEHYAESYLIIVFLGFAGLVYLSYLAYWPWVKPQAWRKRTHRHRSEIQRDWSLLPENVSYRFMKRHPEFDLWYARIGYLAGMILFIAIIVIAYLSFNFVTRP